MPRCDWANKTPLDAKYHDEEWGVPVYDDRLLFEMLILEGAQAGLSWSTILHKREGYRQAFDNFDAKKIANYSESTLEKLYTNPAIVRHKLKINATVTNARCFLDVQREHGSFSAFVWSFVDGTPTNNHWKTLSAVPASTPESDALSSALKKKGFKFIGTTTCYAFMQAAGMVNDHLVSCFRHAEVMALSSRVTP